MYNFSTDHKTYLQISVISYLIICHWLYIKVNNVKSLNTIVIYIKVTIHGCSRTMDNWISIGITVDNTMKCGYHKVGLQWKYQSCKYDVQWESGFSICYCLYSLCSHSLLPRCHLSTMLRDCTEVTDYFSTFIVRDFCIYHDNHTIDSSYQSS